MLPLLKRSEVQDATYTGMGMEMLAVPHSETPGLARPSLKSTDQNRKRCQAVNGNLMQQYDLHMIDTHKHVFVITN